MYSRPSSSGAGNIVVVSAGTDSVVWGSMSNLRICGEAGTYYVGQLIPVTGIDQGIATPARRTVRADGSPRIDLQVVRVVAFQRDSRRLSLDAIRDGIRATDSYLVEVTGSSLA